MKKIIIFLFFIIISNNAYTDLRFEKDLEGQFN